jgi:hypothetical protein
LRYSASRFAVRRDLMQGHLVVEVIKETAAAPEAA